MVIFNGMPPMSSYLLEVAAGRVPGKKAVFKFGRNRDVDTSTTPETIWTRGGIWTPTLAPERHNISSSDALDTLAGTGMQQVKIEGLDASYAEASEIIELDGVNSKLTVNTYSRIFRMNGTAWGSTRRNQGAISAISASTAYTSAIIEAGDGGTFMAVYTVPAGKQALVNGYYASLVKTGGTSGAMAGLDLEIAYVDGGWRKAFSHGISVTGSSVVSTIFDPPLLIPEKTDIAVMCEQTTDNNADIAAAFSFIEEEV